MTNTSCDVVGVVRGPEPDAGCRAADVLGTQGTQGTQGTPCTSWAGGVVLCEDVGVAARLAGGFDGAHFDDGRVVFRGSGWFERMRAGVLSLDEESRRGVRITATDSAGGFDPDVAISVEQALLRLETPWFPSLLEGGCVSFRYQPVRHTEDLSLIGFEALVQSSGPFSEHSAGELLAAARAHGELPRLDALARELAIIEGVRALNDRELFFMNISALAIDSPASCLRPMFEEGKAQGADFTRVVFDIVDVEEELSTAFLRELASVCRAQGARISLSDVGGVERACPAVEAVQPEFTKLDCATLARATAHGDRSQLIAVVDRAHDAGVGVLAVGVETAMQLEIAREIGVDFVQGWLIGRPEAQPVRARPSAFGPRLRSTA